MSGTKNIGNGETEVHLCGLRWDKYELLVLKYFPRTKIGQISHSTNNCCEPKPSPTMHHPISRAYQHHFWSRTPMYSIWSLQHAIRWEACGEQTRRMQWPADEDNESYFYSRNEHLLLILTLVMYFVIFSETYTACTYSGVLYTSYQVKQNTLANTKHQGIETYSLTSAFEQLD